MDFEIRQVNAAQMNQWLTTRHYLHRPVIKSKLVAHAVFVGTAQVGGILWATPHFTKKKGLFGMGNGTLDKWEVLMLARFYLVEDAGLKASAVLSASIGNAGRGRRGRNAGVGVYKKIGCIHTRLYILRILLFPGC